ncbi:MAG: hypothetical protein OHK0035_30910 [Cyanobacteria bacterium J069]
MDGGSLFSRQACQLLLLENALPKYSHSDEGIVIKTAHRIPEHIENDFWTGLQPYKLHKAKEPGEQSSVPSNQPKIVYTKQ